MQCWEGLLEDRRDIDWTIIRPSRLTNEKKGKFRVQLNHCPNRGSKISRSDLAYFISWAGQFLSIHSPKSGYCLLINGNMKTVEIFKTDVQNNEEAARIIFSLIALYPIYKINFDLDDEDNILRIEANQNELEIANIIQCVVDMGYYCERID